MIVGIGHDLVDLRRLRAMCARQARLPRRLLADEEQNEYAARADSLSYLGGRIAAKEAAAKALHLGMRAPLGWRNIWALAGGGGAPVFHCAPPLRKYLTERNIVLHLSITHQTDYAAATVIAESI